MDIDPRLKDLAHKTCDQLMQEIRGAKAVLVSTEDGFEVAARVENTAQVTRLSAMASSLAALGAMAGEESQLGGCASMVMEAAEGFIAIVQVELPQVTFILSVVTGRDAVVGQMLYFAKQAARTLQA